MFIYLQWLIYFVQILSGVWITLSFSNYLTLRLAFESPGCSLIMTPVTPRTFTWIGQWMFPIILFLNSRDLYLISSYHFTCYLWVWLISTYMWISQISLCYCFLIYFIVFEKHILYNVSPSKFIEICFMA